MAVASGVRLYCWPAANEISEAGSTSQLAGARGATPAGGSTRVPPESHDGDIGRSSRTGTEPRHFTRYGRQPPGARLTGANADSMLLVSPARRWGAT